MRGWRRRGPGATRRGRGRAPRPLRGGRLPHGRRVQGAAPRGARGVRGHRDPGQPPESRLRHPGGLAPRREPRHRESGPARPGSDPRLGRQRERRLLRLGRRAMDTRPVEHPRRGHDRPAVAVRRVRRFPGALVLPGGPLRARPRSPLPLERPDAALGQRARPRADASVRARPCRRPPADRRLDGRGSASRRHAAPRHLPELGRPRVPGRAGGGPRARRRPVLRRRRAGHPPPDWRPFDGRGRGPRPATGAATPG